MGAPLLYSASMSLDGFIAGPGGDMAWLGPYVGDESPLTAELTARTGALLVGRRTFDGDDPNAGTDAEGAFGGTYDGPAVLLTRRPPDPPSPGVVVATDLATAVTAARDAAGDRSVCVLGADVARQCLDAGLLDEVVVVVVPVLLGDGVRLLERPGCPPVHLEPVRTSAGTRTTTLWCRLR